METWCDKCQLGHARYRVTYRTDLHIPKYSTPNGVTYTQKVCGHCWWDTWEQQQQGEIWDMRDVVLP